VSRDAVGSRWLVDGMNVIGSRPTGWWRDREGAVRALVVELRGYAEATGERVAVVFDGRPIPLEGGDVEVSFAPARGRDAADDEIVRRVARDPHPAELRVVTSDSELARRSRESGARVVSAGAFRRRLDELAPRPP
jgi:predicted RNA-binding protein with PIN domain